MRSAIEAEDPHLPIGCQRFGPKYLGEPSRTVAALQLHLEQPVLGMHKAETEGGVFVVLRDDQRDAVGITLDADFRFWAGHHEPTVGLRQRRQQIEAEPAPRDKQQSQQADQTAPDHDGSDLP